jgi:hypothetical protein
MNWQLLKQDAESLATIALKERYKPSSIIGNSKSMQDDVSELIG